MKKYKLYIDGAWVDAQEGQYFEVINPATGEVEGMAADATPQDVEKAIYAAHRAFPSWSGTVAKERSELLRRVYDLMLANKEELAELITREMGKPLAEARGELQYAADFVLWYSEEAKRIYGETIPASVPHKRIFVMRQPVGVMAAITPWNFPAAMLTRKVAPALAAGCTCVIKPAEQTPLTAARLVELFQAAGAPAGVINLVTAENPAGVGDVLLGDERVRKVTFTGSTEVGKLIMRKAADSVKRVSLELGGHAPFIVFEDADIEVAVREVMASKFRNAGQACICANRIYVHESILATFANALAAKVRELKMGNGLENGVNVGPLVNHQAAIKVAAQVEDAEAKGATVVTGGRLHTQTGTKGTAYFYEPTILTGVQEGMLVLREETFGPVAPIQSFQSEEEVLDKANNTNYGLAAYLFSKDVARVFRVAEKLEYGIVGVNDGLPSVAQAPFGGYKESGLGREGGKYGIEEYLEVKYISLGLS